MTSIDKEQALTAIANAIRELHNEDAIVVGEKIEEIGLRTAFDIIKRLPTVEERPKGKWIVYWYKDEIYDHVTKCNVCGQETVGRWNYCSNCGSDMRGDKE